MQVGVVPCKDCILLAKCMADTYGLQCSILYEYFIKGGIKTVFHEDSEYYGEPQMGRLKNIEEFYNKMFYHWYLTTEDVSTFDTDPPELIMLWNTGRELIGSRTSTVSRR